MTKIILTTESGSDIARDLAKKHGVYVVPMHIVMDGVDYLDSELPVPEIFEFYEETKKNPLTTSTNPHEYTDFFTHIRNEFPDSTIIHVGYTSKASSSFQNAILAAKEFEDIHLIDTLNVAGGLAAIVWHAVDQLESNPDIRPEELIKEIEAVIPKSRFAFIPGSLDFLKAGGRVSNAAYLAGMLLKIKPRIELVDGKLVSTKKYRGKMSNVAKKLMEDYLSDYKINKEQIYLLYSIGLDEGIKQDAEDLARANGFKNISWIEAGGMISSHSGPGGFGIAGLEE